MKEHAGNESFVKQGSELVLNLVQIDENLLEQVLSLLHNQHLLAQVDVGDPMETEEASNATRSARYQFIHKLCSLALTSTDDKIAAHTVSLSLYSAIEALSTTPEFSSLLIELLARFADLPQEHPLAQHLRQDASLVTFVSL